MESGFFTLYNGTFSLSMEDRRKKRELKKAPPYADRGRSLNFLHPSYLTSYIIFKNACSCEGWKSQATTTAAPASRTPQMASYLFFLWRHARANVLALASSLIPKWKTEFHILYHEPADTIWFLLHFHMQHMRLCFNAKRKGQKKSKFCGFFRLRSVSICSYKIRMGTVFCT